MQYQIVTISHGKLNHRIVHVVATDGEPDVERRVVPRSRLAAEARAWFDSLSEADGVYSDPKDRRWGAVAVRTEAYRVDDHGRRIQLRW